jgi:NAD(P)H-flavin reductase
MAHYKGRIAEILLEAYQNAAGILACPSEAAPKPGQYLQAHNPNDPMQVVPTSLFAAGEIAHDSSSTARLPIAGPLPHSWPPGTNLLLRGPLGQGFSVPRQARRIALIALDRNPGRLLPLVSLGIQQGAEITLLHDGPSDNLPVAVEEQPLDALAKSIKWADYLAIDISIERIDELESIFTSRIPAAVNAEILVAAPMPCGGMAKCGVCTVSTKKGPRLACEDGPVLKLKELV